MRFGTAQLNLALKPTRMLDPGSKIFLPKIPFPNQEYTL
jgi:hypothetical protein